MCVSASVCLYLCAGGEGGLMCVSASVRLCTCAQEVKATFREMGVDIEVRSHGPGYKGRQRGRRYR